VGIGVVVAIAVGGCGPKRGQVTSPIGPPEQPDYSRPLPPGQLALRKVTDPAQIPDFGPAFTDQDGLRQAVNNSLAYLARPSSRRFFPYGQISHDQAVASLRQFLRVLDEAQTPEQFDDLLRSGFDVYTSVGYDDAGTVLFTGYYCPIFDARLKPDERFRYPLHKPPPDLARDPQTGMTLGRRTADGNVVPYYTRDQILKLGLPDHELLWLADPFEAYVVSVQGSARLRLSDGRLMEIGFAGDNGYDYVSVGEAMISHGKLDRNELSLDAMINFFKQHPEQLDVYLPLNPRYVFFKPVSGGPYGCLNVPVLSFRSIATDKDIYPRACLAYAVTELARDTGGPVQAQPFRGFVLDQDRGNAIRAAGRCDVFMGIGAGAGRLAGRTKAEGRLYYLFAKDSTRLGESEDAIPIGGDGNQARPLGN
jgi:membrane-bound lytic murein transglycosylase A